MLRTLVDHAAIVSQMPADSYEPTEQAAEQCADEDDMQLVLTCLDCGERHLSEDSEQRYECLHCGMLKCPDNTAILCSHCTYRVAHGLSRVSSAHDTIPTVEPRAVQQLTTRWMPDLELDFRLLDLHCSTQAELWITEPLRAGEEWMICMTNLFIDVEQKKALERKGRRQQVYVLSTKCSMGLCCMPDLLAH